MGSVLLIIIGPNTLITTVGHPLSPKKRRGNMAHAEPVRIGNMNHGVGSSDHFNIRRKDKPFYSYFQIFLVNLNLSRMPQVPP